MTKWAILPLVSLGLLVLVPVLWWNPPIVDCTSTGLGSVDTCTVYDKPGSSDDPWYVKVIAVLVILVLLYTAWEWVRAKVREANETPDRR